jgi:hypothetical protein
MQAARAMTGFALELTVPERRMRIARRAVRPLEDRQRHFIIVAAKTCVSATARISQRRRFSGRWRCRLGWRWWCGWRCW